jgi:hypothetical protein
MITGEPEQLARKWTKGPGDPDPRAPDPDRRGVKVSILPHATGSTRKPHKTA